jgi:hypothetical protein
MNEKKKKKLEHFQIDEISTDKFSYIFYINSSCFSKNFSIKNEQQIIRLLFLEILIFCMQLKI